MKKSLNILMILLFVAGIVVSNACSAEQEKAMKQGVFEQVAKETRPKEGVKEISYDQFMAIRNSGEKYVLFDVLSPDSYGQGHIEGAISFPVDMINAGSAKKVLSKDSKVIVYCGSFQCHASTNAAKRLSTLGYNVLDYKGGLKEWHEKGNKLVK